MRAHIVLAHPEVKSFNSQLSGITQDVLKTAGYQSTLSDLYAMDFDPREGPGHYLSRKDENVFHTQTEQRFSAENNSTPPDVAQEAQRILDSDLLVIHFPLWWFGMPAILKGWMDRVFVYGMMYRSEMRYDAGICSGKKIIACVTTGAGEDSCSYNGKEGDTNLHLWPILFPFRYLGFDVFEPQIFHGIGGVSFVEGHEDGLSSLEVNFKSWASTLMMLDSRSLIQFNRDQDYDDSNRLVSGAPVYSPFVRHSKDTTPR